MKSIKIISASQVLILDKKLQVHLHFVQIVVELWGAWLQPLALLAFFDDLERLGALAQWISWENLPVVKHALGEGLATGVGSQVSGEAEGLVDRQVGLDDEHGCSWGLSFLKHVSSPSVQDSVDTSNSVLRALKVKMV